MSKDITEFPVFTVDEIKLDPTKVNDLKNEYLKGDSNDFIWTNVLKNRGQYQIMLKMCLIN